MAHSCNGNPVACVRGYCGAKRCTGVAAGAEAGTVACGLVCLCKDRGVAGHCVAPQKIGTTSSYGMITLKLRHIESGSNASKCELLVNADTTGEAAAVSVEMLDAKVRACDALGKRA